MRQTLARLAERLGTVPYPKNMVSGRHSEELVGGRHSEGLVSGRHCDYLVSGRHCEELVAIRHCEERSDVAICCKSKSYICRVLQLVENQRFSDRWVAFLPAHCYLNY